MEGKLAVRIPMKPDADGIIYLSCEGQEIEIQVTPMQLFPRIPIPRSVVPLNPPPIDWSKILPPGSDAKVANVQLIGKSYVDILKTVDKAETDSDHLHYVFASDGAANFHKLFDLAEQMGNLGLSDRFCVAFGAHDLLGRS